MSAKPPSADASGSSPERAGGYVLCRAGPYRLAFFAHQVVSVEAWTAGGVDATHARAGFALDRANGRLLRAPEGDGVVVDALEVLSEPPLLLAAPALMRAQVGGAVGGFLAMQDGLWPVLHLREFARFLGGRAA